MIYIILHIILLFLPLKNDEDFYVLGQIPKQFQANLLRESFHMGVFNKYSVMSLVCCRVCLKYLWTSIH